jgi:protein SCO1/2
MPNAVTLIPCRRVLPRISVYAAILGPIAVATVTFADAAVDVPRGGRADVVQRTQSTVGSVTRYFPDVTVRTHEGTRVQFHDLIKGKLALINFMFTSCTTQCPLTTANLVKVEEALGDRLGRDVLMISVTVDPATDTPEVLKQYSKRYGTKPGWYFVTGSQKEVELIRRRLGVYDNDTEKTQHTGILVYGNDATGQWAATPAMAPPSAIVRSVMGLLDP